MSNFTECVAALGAGEVIAYPTESVFGLGCDPDNIEAIKKLLEIKQREKSKGLILIASTIEQLIPYVNFESLSLEVQNKILHTWPGPVTWLIPSRFSVSNWLKGQFDTVAVRISSHPDVQTLCQKYGKPITSTSANLSGLPPCRSFSEVEAQFGEQVPYILQGHVGERANPSEIRDAITGDIIRLG